MWSDPYGAYKHYKYTDALLYSVKWITNAANSKQYKSTDKMLFYD